MVTDWITGNRKVEQENKVNDRVEKHDNEVDKVQDELESGDDDKGGDGTVRREPVTAAAAAHLKDAGE